jgi:[protein-PII] uridylyltransferase
MLKHDSQGLIIPPEVFNADSFLLALKGSKSRIPLFKKNIERSSDFLHQQFQKGHNIRELIWARSTFIDQLLRCAWQLFDWPEDEISLVAVGGYGRGELHPHSDIDLLILLREDILDDYQQQVSDFLTLLWDINLDIGHSVRTISECVTEAAREITVATNLMESRTLIGSPTIHATLMPQLDADNIWPSREFFRAKWDEQIERHRKHGNSEYNLEPNVKSSPGGLRDIQMIGWIAKRHFGTKNFADFYQQGLLLKEELDILNNGMDFLWRVRYGLHMISGREEDRLLFDHQRTLAKLFGYDDGDQRLAVEKFMQQYYRSALALGQLNDVLIQYFDESILRSQDDDVVTRINERFRIHNGHIEVSHDNVFIETPSALLEVFVLMAKSHNIDGARASTIRLIRNSTHLIDDTFRNDPVVTGYFMDILRSPEKVALQLRRMLRFGVLGKYLPPFGKIIGQMQHDLFHIYSVDAHTMEVVKNMRRFHYRELQHKFPVASRLVKRLDKIELLYIAGLYHDIGKGRGGNHSLLGADDAQLFCFRHQLNKRDTNLVCWLVRNHLLMSSVAQRKDISDPDVIREFAEIVGDRKYLDFIYLLTVADINATNPNLWNSWRASLLRQLYAETKRALRRGLENPVDKQDWIEENQNRARESLENLGFIEEEINGIWSNTEEEYFLREKVDDIVWHTEAIAQHSNTQQPLILLKESSEIDFEGATQIFVHTKTQSNLFAIIAAALEQLDLNIQDARIYTSGSGFSLDTFFVLDNDGEPIGNNSERSDEIISLLQKYINSPDQHSEIMNKRTPRTLRLFSTPTQTTMVVDKARNYSILEVITPDRPGLLARIGKIFYDFDIQIQNAKITTLGERVEDVFFITNKDNQPIEDPELQESIQQAICKELNEQAGH